MANVIKIKKGLDISLAGRASQREKASENGEYICVAPDHFTGFQPRLDVKVGDRVLAGSPVLHHKNCPQIVVSSS